MASRLDNFIPRPRVLERDRVAVVADVPMSWEAVRHLDGRKSRFVRALFSLRHLSDVINHRSLDAKDSDADRRTLDELTQPGGDLQVLAEEPGRSFVVGSIARFGDADAPPRHVPLEEFAAFDEPGYGKLAWGLSVEERQSGGSWITFELRIGLTDEATAKAFDAGWKLIAPFIHAVRTVVLGLLEKQLDAIDPEHTALPGDLLMPARFTRTLGVVVEARPEEVWPWLMQLGAGRAGWYGMDAPLEADHLHPEWQSLEVGSLISPQPGSPSKLEVLMLEPARALVLGSPTLKRTGPLTMASGLEPDFKLTWAFVLEPIGDEACWLGARVRADSAYGLEVALARGWEVLAQKVLQRTQLQNIKLRAEHRLPARSAELQHASA